ncbi:MAG TPA: hypothetical protein VJO53_03780 [Candidatus Acidoferrales bacterium]|nr:hypothetical protein [Candidatus Acidoferrales bacterium]
MKIHSFKIPPARPYAAPGRANIATVHPSGTLDDSVTPSAPVKRAIASQDREHGQRVLLRIRASIHVALQGKAATFEVSTLSVTPRGALVVMNRNLPAETKLVLEHMGTKQRVNCKVVRPSRETREGFQVPLEFDSPTPGFWKIDFPPTDWHPDDV